MRCRCIVAVLIHLPAFGCGSRPKPPPITDAATVPVTKRPVTDAANMPEAKPPITHATTMPATKPAE
jgi:hypothetical protein